MPRSTPRALETTPGALLRAMIINRPRLAFVTVGTLVTFAYGVVSFGREGDFIYPMGFASIGAALGLQYIVGKRVSDPAAKGPGLSGFIPLVFAMLGLGFSCLLHLRFESAYRLSDLRGYEFFVPVAVGCFVYIFWIAFFSIRNLVRLWMVITATFVPILAAVCFIYAGISDRVSPLLIMVDPTVLTVNYCAASLVIFCTAALFSKDYFKNILLNMAVFAGSVIVVANACMVLFHLSGMEEDARAGVVAVTSFAILIVWANGHVIYKYYLGRKNVDGLDRRVTVAFEWIFLFPALIANYSIYLALAAFLPYRGIVRNLSDKDGFDGVRQLDPRGRNSARRLALGAFLTYSSLIVMRQEMPEGFVFWMLHWLVGSLVACTTLAMCLYDAER